MFTLVRRLSRGVALALLAVACTGGGPTQPSGGGGPSQPSGGGPSQPSGGIGPAGGTVTTPDGRAALIVPPNALAASTALSITDGGANLDPGLVTSSVYSVVPAGTQFAVPATLTLRYNPDLLPAGTAEADLRIYRRGTSGWTADAASTIDAVTHTGTASITTGGDYAVRWMWPAGPCTDPVYRQFDFWLGSWKVSGGGSLSGEVTADASGCAIEEVFQKANGGAWMAVTRYSPADHKWHQTGVDDWYGRYEMSGTLEGGTMRLYWSPNYRSAWIPGVGQVRYVEETSYDGGMTWGVAFELTYVRR